MDKQEYGYGNGGLTQAALAGDRPLFSPGWIVATPAALDACERAASNPIEYLNRHLFGDWGHRRSLDRRANDTAVQLGARILSSYELVTGERIWVITEWDRSLTTIVLPSEIYSLQVRPTTSWRENH